MSRLVLNISTDLLKVPEGATLVLHDARRLTVDENMGDGQWLSCAGEDGESELVHAQDIAEVHVGE